MWSINTREKIIYLTFDDGPHPNATPFVLDELRKFDAAATFFCLGKNVQSYPDIYQRILEEGHSTGNHTYNHLNGWRTANKKYFEDVAQASKYISSPLFRPPYGKIRLFQAKNIAKVMSCQNAKIIMWDVLSGDFDTNISTGQCLQNVVLNAKQGSIVVFHDSEKALPLLTYTLPRTMEHFYNKGFKFERLEDSWEEKGKLVKEPGGETID